MSGELRNSDSFSAMMAGVQAFHDKHALKSHGGEDLHYRIALMVEELGEIASCVTKGEDSTRLAEECADLLILLMGTAVSADLDLNQAFWEKLERIAERPARMVGQHIRVSEFGKRE